jgi:glycosyltransferase involved in cell wall biosynthesis
MATVSFVIPHLGRIEMLDATIASILAQTAAEQIAQIIVVTKNSTPLLLPEHPKLQILYRPEAKTISEQRNIGAAVGNSEYLAFLDADIKLSDNWLISCLQCFERRPELGVVSGVQVNAVFASRTEQVRTAIASQERDTEVTALPGCNLLVRRDFHIKVGGFPEHIATCEDIFYTRALSVYGPLYKTASATFVHLGEDKSLAVTFKKEIWRSEHNLQSLQGRKIPLREWPSILLPFWVLLALLMLGVSIWQPALLLPAAVLAMLPALAYSTRLFMLPGHGLNFGFIFVFYMVYFSARSLGTLAGIRFLLPGRG